MRYSSSTPAMIALAAVLSAPLIIEVQASLTQPVAAPATLLFAGRPRVNGAPIAPDASVYSPQNERIGSIADVLQGSGNDGGGVVLSLGGYRGIIGKLVEIPRSLLRVVDDKLVITGVTKDQLMQLPEYQYGSRS